MTTTTLWVQHNIYGAWSDHSSPRNKAKGVKLMKELGRSFPKADFRLIERTTTTTTTERVIE